MPTPTATGATTNPTATMAKPPTKTARPGIPSLRRNGKVMLTIAYQARHHLELRDVVRIVGYLVALDPDDDHCLCEYDRARVDAVTRSRTALVKHLRDQAESGGANFVWGLDDMDHSIDAEQHAYIQERVLAIMPELDGVPV